MALQLGDAEYDSCVKDYARCSFVVPREYVMFVDMDGLFSERPIMSFRAEQSEAKNDNKEGSFPETYESIPYEKIVQTLEEQMGGQPEHGSRNTFIFSMACHLRYVCNDDATWIAQVLPTYGEAKEKWMASIRSACSRSQTKTMPRIMRRTLKICKERMQDESDIINQQSEIDSPPKMPNRLPPLIKLLISRTLGNMLATWKKRKYIEPYGEEMTGDQQGRQQYRKTETYLKKR